jgi:hypothetical protein
MADYNFREIENRPTTTYDADDKQRIFADDFTQLQQCILDLKARVEALEA